jgi:hypothetical protein
MRTFRKCHQTIVLNIPVRSVNTFYFSRDRLWSTAKVGSKHMQASTKILK